MAETEPQYPGGQQNDDGKQNVQTGRFFKGKPHLIRVKIQGQPHAVNPGGCGGKRLLRGGKAGGKVRYGGAVMGQPQAVHVGFGGKNPVSRQVE